VSIALKRFRAPSLQMLFPCTEVCFPTRYSTAEAAARLAASVRKPGDYWTFDPEDRDKTPLDGSVTDNRVILYGPPPATAMCARLLPAHPTFRGRLEGLNGRTHLIGRIRGAHHLPLAVWLGGCVVFAALLLMLGASLPRLAIPLTMAVVAVAVTMWGVWLGRHARARLMVLITEALESGEDSM
jgi:hypothetical protein